MEKKQRRYFPDEFKRQAVERVETRGLPLFEVAAELGVHESQLRRWARQFGQTGALTTRRRFCREASGPSPADLVAENARLKRELHRAEAERDILKKAALIFGAATR
jgi:transposase